MCPSKEDLHQDPFLERARMMRFWARMARLRELLGEASQPEEFSRVRMEVEELEVEVRLDLAWAREEDVVAELEGLLASVRLMEVVARQREKRATWARQSEERARQREERAGLREERARLREERARLRELLSEFE